MKAKINSKRIKNITRKTVFKENNWKKDRRKNIKKIVKWKQNKKDVIEVCRSEKKWERKRKCK